MKSIYDLCYDKDMKELLRNIFVTSLSLFITSQIFSGLKIHQDLLTFAIAGAVLAVITIIFDPIVKFLTLPFTLLSLGLLSFLSTLLSLLVLTYVFPSVQVTAFTFEGFSFAGIEIKRIFLSSILSFTLISATIYLLKRAVYALLLN